MMVAPVYPKPSDPEESAAWTPDELMAGGVDIPSLAPGSLASMDKSGWPGAHVQPDPEPTSTLETPTEMPTPPDTNFYQTFLAAVDSKIQELGLDQDIPTDRYKAVVAVTNESPDLVQGLSADDILAAAKPRAVAPIVGRKAPEVIGPACIQSSEPFDAFSDPETARARYLEYTRTPTVPHADPAPWQRFGTRTSGTPNTYAEYRKASHASGGFTSAGITGDTSAFKPGLYASADVDVALTLGDNVSAGERRNFDRYEAIAKAQKLRLSEPTDRFAAMRQVALERIASEGASVASARTFAEAVLLYRCKNALTFRDGDSRQAHAAVAKMRPDLVSYPPAGDVVQCAEPFDVPALFRECLAARNLPDTNANRRLVADDVIKRMTNAQ
ncbi:MAG TPA: hypothetical protein VGR62_20620 [Candidatus Binatia bacterium]|jgi:hypothetical protein|nr:hypothetical protein [Candidatus Binatia bacterium]